MDISGTLAPNSEQLDAVDLISGPRIFTIESVSKGKDDQPVNLHLADFPRAWRPGKSMRRVLVACWGPDAAQYVGRRVELYCDPEVSFGGMAVGGTRISRLSHLPKTKLVPLLVSRGKSAMFTVKPLPDEPAPKAAATTEQPPTRRDVMFQLLTDTGRGDKEAALAYLSKITTRTIGSSADLNEKDIEDVIAELQIEKG